jgi:CRISPR type I-E-associated protein CasB/Cse2
MTYRGPEWAIDLADQLEKWRNNTGVMADLRRGRGKEPKRCVSMHRWISRFVSESQVGSSKEWAVYTVASQFALHNKIRTCEESLGWSLKNLTLKESLSSQQIETRLLRLAKSRNSAELCRRLPGVLSLFTDGKTPLSWSLLASDINSWDFDRYKVIRRWLRDFFDPSAINSPGQNASITTQGES